jgi:hypothetical protein
MVRGTDFFMRACHVEHRTGALHPCLRKTSFSACSPLIAPRSIAHRESARPDAATKTESEGVVMTGQRESHAPRAGAVENGPPDDDFIDELDDDLDDDLDDHGFDDDDFDDDFDEDFEEESDDEWDMGDDRASDAD